MIRPVPRRPVPDPRRTLVVLAAATLGALLLSEMPAPAVAQADPIGCGSVIRSNTVLVADVVGCTGDGLVIGASGITLDLGGHIVGAATGTVVDPSQVGIDDSAGFDDVTIGNGSVRDFDRGGVHLVGADRSTVQALSVTLDYEFGIRFDGGSGNRAVRNHVESIGTVGIGVFGTDVAARDNSVTGNTISGAATADIAVRYGTVTGTRIEDNTLSQLDLVERWGAPIAIAGRYTSGEGSFAGTLIRGNRVTDSFAGGVYVGDSAPDASVIHNVFDNVYGLPAIETDAARTAVAGNTVQSSAFPGSTGFGVQVDADATDTRVTLNRLHDVGEVSLDDSGTRTLLSGNFVDAASPTDGLPTGVIAGIFVRAPALDARVLGNVVRRQSPGFEGGAGIAVLGARTRLVANLVSDTAVADGIWVQPQASGTAVRANLVTANGADGLRVDDRSAVVTANLALRNGDFGISAVDGVSDGGGNRATGNGEPGQCVGVRCSIVRA